MKIIFHSSHGYDVVVRQVAPGEFLVHRVNKTEGQLSPVYFARALGWALVWAGQFIDEAGEDVEWSASCESNDTN